MINIICDEMTIVTFSHVYGVPSKDGKVTYNNVKYVVQKVVYAVKDTYNPKGIDVSVNVYVKVIN